MSWFSTGVYTLFNTRPRKYQSPGNFTCPGIFSFPVKASIHKSAYFFESNNNWKQKLSGLNDSFYVLTPFLT